MKGYARIWILALAALIFAGPTAVIASDFAPMQLAASHDDDADLLSETSNSDAAIETDNETDETIAEPAKTSLIDTVSVMVQNANEDAIEEAKIELSTEESGASFKKITDDEGIATFNELPAENLHVKVTARGYRSYTGEFSPEDGDDPIVIELKKRD